MPTSDRFRCRRESGEWVFVASMKTLSGLRSPTNRDVDNSTSWEATSAVDDASSFCSEDSGEMGSRPGCDVLGGCGRGCRVHAGLCAGPS